MDQLEKKVAKSVGRGKTVKARRVRIFHFISLSRLAMGCHVLVLDGF